MIQFELTRDELILIDDEEDSCVVLSAAQLKTIIEFVRTHPCDSHGWANNIKEDGTLTGNYMCPCHNVRDKDGV